MSTMGGDKVPSHHAVAVHKEKIVPRGKLHRFIAGLCRPESSILLPSMKDGNRRNHPKPLDQETRRLLRSIVRYNHLKVRVGLSHEAAKRQLQRLGPVVCGENHGNLHCAESSLFIIIS